MDSAVVVEIDLGDALHRSGRQGIHLLVQSGVGHSEDLLFRRTDSKLAQLWQKISGSILIDRRLDLRIDLLQSHRYSEPHIRHRDG